MMPISDILKRIARLGWRDYEPAGPCFLNYSVLHSLSVGNPLRPNFSFSVHLAQELHILCVWRNFGSLQTEDNLFQLFFLTSAEHKSPLIDTEHLRY